MNVVYVDPIHNFAFLHFNIKILKNTKPFALSIRPDLAKVGVQIRLVGNDADHGISILPGIISRIDRNAPELDEYPSDLNINYIQASANTAGGSSGSPVVNNSGHVVALNASRRCLHLLLSPS